MKAAMGGKMSNFASAPAPVKFLACSNAPNKAEGDNERLRHPEWRAPVEQLTVRLSLPAAKRLKGFSKTIEPFSILTSGRMATCILNYTGKTPNPHLNRTNFYYFHFSEPKIK